MSDNGEVQAQGGDATAGANMSKEDYNAKARAAGWTETTAFDYDQFQRMGGNDATWHATAGVYEWNDEYGDVGPEVPELERVLFGGEFQMTKGNHMEALDLEVTVEGPDKLSYIRKVSLLYTNTLGPSQLSLI